MDKFQQTAEKTPEDESKEHLSSAMLKDFFDRNFNKLNQDKDNFLSATELTSALHGNLLTGKDARIAEAIIPNIHPLELLSNDEWGTENNGVTRKDISAFEKARREDPNDALAQKLVASMNANEHNPQKFVELLNIYKSKIDQDKSKSISRAELEDYLAKSKDSPAALGVAQVLLKHFDPINELGSKYSCGSYRSVLHGDGNSKAISDGELTALQDVLGPDAKFREKLWKIHGGNDATGDEIGKQARSAVRPGDGAGVLVTSLIFETIGGAIAASSRSTMEGLMLDYDTRKKMLQSWNHFDR